MVAVSWTDEQRKAIEKNGCNLLVAAAAGSGKTAVLVEKIVNMVSDGTDIDTLLVTTFTDAAAKKMKQEIGAEIKRRLLCDNGNAHLIKQLVLLGRADICTIDSFCMKVVRANFHLLDIDPDFKIADNNEGELLRAQAAQEVFAELYESNDNDFYDMLECYAGQRGDEMLLETVLSLHRFIRTMPDYKSWLSKCVDMYTGFEDVFDSRWGEIVRQSTCVTVEGCISRAKDALEYAAETEEMASYVVPLKADIAALEDILASVGTRNFDEAAEKIRGFVPEKGGRAKPKTPDEVKRPVSESRAYIKEQMESLANKFYYDTQTGIAGEAKQTGRQVRALCRLADMVETRFFEIKKKRSILDFSDIEHLALQALTDNTEEGPKPSAAALELCEKYKMILIDEYQDSNELQETIFARITNGSNIFMVGDIKQSIYRFRHTNPLLFRAKKDTYSDSEGINQRVIMSKNFRSRREIIDGVNFIMEQNVSPLVGEIVYDETEALSAGASYPDSENAGGAVEVHIIDSDAENADGEEGGTAVSGAEAEAVCVAKRILRLVRSGFEVFDKNDGMRPVKYKDIVILMRSPSADAQIFADVLTSYGIPTFSDVGGGYFVSEEIELVLSLLSIIDNPVQDIKLLGVMRSAIGGFTDTELAEIRLCDSESDIYDALISCAETDTAVGKKCAGFLSRLEEWRRHSLHMEVHELIWYLYNDTGYFDFVAAGTAGKQRRANLNLLIEYARSYERTSFKGLFNFVNYAERVKNANRDVGGAKILGENQDVVRIMSVHKSKGLEFGVVFLTRLAKQFNTSDLKQNVLMHSELGIGVDFIDTESRYKYPTFIKRAIREKMNYEMMSEEIRVLYVALTRAREKLILTMAPGRTDLKRKKWLSGARGADKRHLPLYYTASANGLSDWVMGALMRHEACRQFAGENLQCIDSSAKFEVYSYSETAENIDLPVEDELPKASYGEYSEAIDKILGYEYPHKGARDIPTKVSVTEMKRIVNNELDASEVRLCGEELIQTPSFLAQKSKMSAAQKGSALHFVMQNLSFDKPLDERGITCQIEDMLKQKIIKQEQAEAAEPKKLSKFFESALGHRILASKKVVRESPFEVSLDAEKVFETAGSGEKVLLQGIIDCYFYEDDEIVLVDYKTDYVYNESGIAEIKQRYETQLELYAQALEKITHKRVKEKKLYLFSCESVVDY